MRKSLGRKCNIPRDSCNKYFYPNFTMLKLFSCLEGHGKDVGGGDWKLLPFHLVLQEELFQSGGGVAAVDIPRPTEYPV